MTKFILKFVFMCFAVVVFAQKTNKTTSTAPTKTSTTKPASTPPSQTTTKAPATTTTAPAKCVPVAGKKTLAFTGSFLMNFTINENGTSKSGKIFYAFDCYQTCMIPTFDLKTNADYKMRAITDISEGTITMLTEDSKGKKSGLIFNIPKKVITTNANTIKFTTQKTTETKVIEGYTCTKWITNGDNGVVIVSWISDKITLNYKEMLSSIGQSFKGKSPFENSYAKEIAGFSLETIVTDAQKKSTTTITLSGIKQERPDGKLFSTDGYSLMDARGLPIFGGQ